MSASKAFKLNLCLATAVAVATPAPAAWAKERKSSDSAQLQKLAEENAKLRQELAQLRREREQWQAVGATPAKTPAQAPTPGEENPFQLRDLEQGHAVAAGNSSQGKRQWEMSCGAAMMKGGEMSCGGNMGMGGMEPGSQMQFNPYLAGSDFYHVHPPGMWMFNYKFMHMEMGGLRDGTRDVEVREIDPRGTSRYNYMMAPTKMAMDMHMLMGMVGLTDRLTVMGMVNYLSSEMYMKMNMGRGFMPDPPMRTNGLGDTEVDVTYAFDKSVFGTLGVSIPTGSVSQRVAMMGREFRAPYSMQNGSGTVDLKPSLSYHGLTDDALWMWGSQATYTWHLGETRYHYARGDNFKITGFLQRAFGKASTSFRLVYNTTGRIRGSDAGIDKLMAWAPSPDADPDNYGSQRLDALVGAAYEKGPFSFGVEGGAPLYEELNGLQMKNKWMVNAGFQAMF